MLERITTLAAGPQREFPLSATPVSDSGISVTVDDVLWDRSRWSYVAARNAIVFDAASVPAAGQRIQIRYRALCPPP